MMPNKDWEKEKQEILNSICADFVRKNTIDGKVSVPDSFYEIFEWFLTSHESQVKEEINGIFEEVKKRHDFWLSPSQQAEFWSDFGIEIHNTFLVEQPPQGETK